MKRIVNFLCTSLCLFFLVPVSSMAGQTRTVHIEWTYPSPPADLTAFRVYESGIMVKEIPVPDPSSPPLQVDFQMDIDKGELNFSIVAVAGDAESGHSVYPPVNVPPLITSFTATPSSLENPEETATFTVVAEDVGGDPISYTIDFGDGTSPGSGSQQIHFYQRPGTFTATATADDGKNNNTKILEVVVNDFRPGKPRNVVLSE